MEHKTILIYTERHTMARTGHIYRLWSPESTEFFIGATVNMRKKKYNHKNKCNNPDAQRQARTPLYQHIRANGGWDAWRMDLVETVQFDTRAELNAIEGRHIRELSPSLNRQLPGRTENEYQRAYRQTPNGIARYERSIERVICPDCGIEYTRSGKTLHLRRTDHMAWLNRTTTTSQ